MKRIIYLAMCLTLTAVLSACGQKAEPSIAEGSTEEAQVESEEIIEGNVEEEASEETASEEVVTISHEYGETQVKVNPEKIAVMDFGTLDILDAVGIEVGALAKGGTMPEYLSAYQSDAYVNCGTLKEADFEALNEYAPELIIISARLSGSYEELSQIAPTLYVTMPGADYFNEIDQNVQILKQIFPGKADDLQKGYDEIKTKADALKADAQQTGFNSLTLLANDGAFSVYGVGSRYGMINSDFGFLPADENIEASTHGMEASYEYIAEKNPDVLFVIDRSAAIGTEGAAGAATLLDNDLVNSTEAAKEGRIVYLASDIWYLSSGGFTGTSQMIDEVRTALE